MVADEPCLPESQPPRYDDLFSSHLSPSRSSRNANEDDNDAEQQVLLSSSGSGSHGSPGHTMDGYHAPTVETPRSSEESGEYPPSATASTASSYERFRGEIAQMEILEAPSDMGLNNPSRFRKRLTKQLTAITTTLSLIQRQFSASWPSFGYVRSRLPHGSLAELNVIGRILGIVLVIALTYFLMSLVLPSGKVAMGRTYDPESVRQYVQGHVDENRIRGFLQHLTAYDHVAGTKGDLALAKYVQTLFVSTKLEEVEVNEYEVYLNYPRPYGRRVAIVEPADLVWEAQLEEELVYPDDKSSRVQTPVFHGHSRAGNVTGPLVYANYGSREDFRSLEQRGINLTGTIALVRYYGSQGDRALKVKAAELAGAVGCLIYSDPSEDGFKKGEVWPVGRWRPSDSVQRGAVSLMSWVIGDVLTPGFASTKDAKRVSTENNAGLVNIPSLPLAWRDAQKLLQSIKGHGEKVEDNWVGGVPEVDEWWSGDQRSPIVRLANEQDEEERQPIWNVLGKITGLERQAKSIIVGNHRDSWCFGAADPGSGTAILLEVVHIFSELFQLGWRPLRTIQFASWDGEEYNLIGSTEWVEDHIDDLRRNAMAYLNIDAAVTGTEFHAAASPMFQRALLRVLDRTADPIENQTLRYLWDKSHKRLGGLGAGSDYVAFQDLAGTSSIDMSFQGPGFPYHSCYDNLEWLEKFGDPGLRYHQVLAQVWALLILEVADQPVLPFDLVAYASAVEEYIRDLETYVKENGGDDQGGGLNLDRLREVATLFMHDAETFHVWDRTWTEAVFGAGGFETEAMAIRRMSHNARMTNFETNLLDLSEGGGLPGREQFKHILFAPQAWSGYDEAYFPGVRDAVNDGNWTLAQQQADKAAEILEKASHKLLH